MIGGFLQPSRGEYLPDWIDWLWTHEQEIVFTATGGLLRVAAIEPPDLETAGRGELVAFHAQLAEVLSLPGTGWAAWFDQWRREDRGYLPESDFGGNVAAQLVDAARRAQFADAPRAVFANRAYVALHWTPQPRDAALAFLHDRDPQSAREIMQAFLDQSGEFFRGLAHICPQVRVLKGHALGTYLAETVTYRRVPTALPDAFLAPQLAVCDWDGGTELSIDGLHVAAVEVHVFGAVSPLSFEALHELPFECRWSTVVRFLDPEDQRAELGRLRNQWRPKQYGWGGWMAVIITKGRSHSTARADVDAVMAEIDDLEANLQQERDGLAIATMTVRVWDENASIAEDRASTVVGLLNAAGMRARVATFNATLGALADIPGNASRDLVNRRKPKIRLSTIGRCTPMTGLTTGHREDEHLDGPALLVGKSRRLVPLFWSLHAPGSDVGHFAMIGPTGSGKSTLLAFMALQFLRYPGSTVTIFDKRRSAMVPTLCADDSCWLELGAGGIGVQPLRDIDDAAGLAWATTWLGEALKMRQVMPSSRLDSALQEALTPLRKMSPDERTISALCAHLGGHQEALAALKHYTTSGPLGEVMDGAVPGYGSARLLTIEIDPVMHLAEAPLVLAACFRQLERERFGGGHPKLVMIDEAWQPLEHPLFLRQITDSARTMRKMNGVLGLFTQSIRDLSGAQTGVIMEQLAQAVFLPDAQATHEGSARLYRDVGLTEQQIQTLVSMRAKGEYLFRTRDFTRVVDLTLEGDAVRICGASRDGDIRRARALLAEGVRPGQEFCARWLDATS